MGVFVDFVNKSLSSTQIFACYFSKLGTIMSDVVRKFDNLNLLKPVLKFPSKYSYRKISVQNFWLIMQLAQI